MATAEELPQLFLKLSEPTQNLCATMVKQCIMINNYDL